MDYFDIEFRCDDGLNNYLNSYRFDGDYFDRDEEELKQEFALRASQDGLWIDTSEEDANVYDDSGKRIDFFDMEGYQQ